MNHLLVSSEIKKENNVSILYDKNTTDMDFQKDNL